MDFGIPLQSTRVQIIRFCRKEIPENLFLSKLKRIVKTH